MNEMTRDMKNLPGPGDPETWGPCTGHPMDPRTEDVRDTRLFEDTKEYITSKRFADLRGSFLESFTEYCSDEWLKELAEAIQSGDAQKAGDMLIDECYRNIYPSDEDVIERMNIE